MSLLWLFWDLFGCEAYDSFQIVCAMFVDSTTW